MDLYQQCLCFLICCLGWSYLSSKEQVSFHILKAIVFPVVMYGCGSWTNLDSILKSRDIVDKGPSSQSYGFSSSHVWMWELDYKKSWAPKNWCFWTVVLEKTLESSLDCKEIKPVNPKGNQSPIFIGRTDAEAEASILWPLCEELIHWKRPWCWERLKAGGEGDNRGWDG